MKTGNKRLPQWFETLRFRFGSTELLSAGSVLLSAALLGLVLLFSDSTPSASRARPLWVEDRMLTLEERAAAPKPSAAAPEMTPAPAHSVQAFMEQEHVKLQEENRALKTRLDALVKWILANVRGKYPLPEKFMARLRMDPLAGDYSLNEDVAEFLKVTPVEKQKINDALQAASDLIRQVEAATISIKNPREDKVILTIPAFEEEGKIMKEDLYAALEVTLGGARFDRFLEVSEQDLQKSFYHFGAASRTMIFELAYNSETGMPELVIRDAWIVPGPNNTRTIEAKESTVDRLPDCYRGYLAWLPDYISAYSAE